MQASAVADPGLDEAQTYLQESFADSSASAEAAGMTVVRSTPTTLLLDLDNGAAQDTYRRMLPYVVRSRPGTKETARWTSKSGKGMHVVVSIPEPLNVTERLLLQAALGSDLIREMLGLSLLQSGIDNPIMLFKPTSSLDLGEPCKT